MLKQDLQQKPHSQSAGFSLVETLVAISILLTVISGIMLLVNQSIESEGRLSNRLVASYLASDVIEYLRYQRDTAWLKGDTFDTWVEDGLNFNPGNDCASKKCLVDTRIGSDSITACTACDPLQYNSSTKRFGHDSGPDWEASKFTRVMQVQQINNLDGDSNDEEVVIEVTVQWENQAGNTTDLVLTDSLTAWGD